MVTRSIPIYQSVARHQLERMNHLVFGWDSLMEDEKIHIANIAASVMMTRDNFLRGGGFVTAVIDNNLREALMRADTQISKAVRFMVWVKDNSFVEPVFQMEKVETNLEG
jgi:hypothetical protein